MVVQEASPTKSRHPLYGISSPSRQGHPSPPPPHTLHGISSISPGISGRQAQASPASGTARADAQQAVWTELFSLVQHLDDTVDTALQAFAPEGSGDSKVGLLHSFKLRRQL